MIGSMCIILIQNQGIDYNCCAHSTK